MAYGGWGRLSTITEPSGTLGGKGEPRLSSEPVGDGGSAERRRATRRGILPSALRARAVAW